MSRLAAFLLCAGLVLPWTAFAHGTESHAEKAAQPSEPVRAPVVPANTDSAQTPKPDEPKNEAQTDAETQKTPPAPERRWEARMALSIDALMRDLNFAEFPTLHPMAVHVPVTFIPLALLFALIGLFTVQRAFTGLACAFTLGGLAGGAVAAFPLHPHTTGLPPAAQVALQKHDLFAYGTLWLALLAAVIGLICLWRPGGLRKLAFALMLLLATLSVSITAHYGGTLAYVHGIGVQGRYLSPH